MEQMAFSRFRARGSKVEGGDARPFVFHMLRAEKLRKTIGTKSDEIKHASDVSGFRSF